MRMIDVELRMGQHVDDVVLFKNDGDQMRWISKDEDSYDVTFTGDSPFAASTFSVPAGKSALSGPVGSEVDPPEDPEQAVQFKYSVRHVPSGWMLDPRVGVKR